jgi:hypothetical protein
MKKEPIIKNNKVKDELMKRVRAHAFEGDGNIDIEAANTLFGLGAHGVNSALFNMPSKNKTVKNFLEEFKNAHPAASKIGEIGGETASWFLPGNLVKGALKGVKGVKTIPKVLNFLDKGKLKNVIANDLFHTAAYAPIKAAGEGESLGKTALRNALERFTFSGLEAGLKPAFSLLGKALRRNKITKGRNAVAEIAERLRGKLGAEEAAKIEKIIANPTKSAHIDYNNLLLNPTEKTKAIADAAYLKSPKARKIIETQSKILKENQMPQIKEFVSEISHGRTPNSEEFLKRIKGHADVKAKPLYEEAYKAPTIENNATLEYIKGDPKFVEAQKEAMKSFNINDIGQTGYAENDIRVLHKTKKKLDQAESRLRKVEGKAEDAREVSIPRKKLNEILKEASPEYAQANKLEHEAFKVKDAIAEGKEATKKGYLVEDLKSKLKNMNARERAGVRQSYLEELLNNAETRAGAYEAPNISSQFTNSQTRKKLETLINKDSVDKMLRNIGTHERAHKTLSEITKGSATAKHLANEGAGGIDIGTMYTAARAAGGSTRAQVRLLTKLQNALTRGKTTKNAASEVKLLLNPKMLKNIKKPKETKLIKNIRNYTGRGLGEAGANIVDSLFDHAEIDERTMV